MSAIVRKHGMDFVRHSCDQGSHEVGRGLSCGLLMQFGEREFRCAVDGHEEMELALLGSDLGNIDVKIADRIGLEGFPGRFIAFDIGQPADAVAPVATV